MKWLRNFMYGRYGVDQLGNFLFIFYIILAVVSFVYPPVIFICYPIIIYTLFRMFSKQYYKRRAENDWYLQKTAGIRKFFKRQQNKWKYRKTHKYLKCPHCHQYLRVPRGKGEITVTCPSCHQQFDQRT
ncbi:MAG: hypothetical protein KHZ15_11615 [Coprobacillus cateniformis]|uniref:hypothetical protein n=1 Tax=Longibaculum muris TaxID=1796628 RepID=UPI003AB8F1AB|nr:hypothetical protein [Coprobacillus cateniformis]